MLAKLGLTKGDTLYAIDQPDGVRLTTADPNSRRRWMSRARP